MPRFYVHLHDCGTLVDDDDGIQCNNVADAREAAIRAVRDVMCSEVREGRLCLSCRIIVVGETGHEVALVSFQQAVWVTGV